MNADTTTEATADPSTAGTVPDGLLDQIRALGETAAAEFDRFAYLLDEAAGLLTECPDAARHFTDLAGPTIAAEASAAALAAALGRFRRALLRHD